MWKMQVSVWIFFGWSKLDKCQGSFCAQSVLPLPPGPGFPHPVHTELEAEPQFCPRVHLSLTRPEYVVTFPHMARAARAPPVIPGTRGSDFAWSGPFNLLSQEGLRVIRDIVRREEHRWHTGDLDRHVIMINMSGPWRQSGDLNELWEVYTTAHLSSEIFKIVQSYWKCSKTSWESLFCLTFVSATPHK